MRFHGEACAIYMATVVPLNRYSVAPLIRPYPTTIST